MQTTLYVEPTNVETRHYDTFSVVEIANGVKVHFSDTLDNPDHDTHVEQAQAFATKITTPYTEPQWLEGIDVRIDGVGTLRPTIAIEER